MLLKVGYPLFSNSAVKPPILAMGFTALLGKIVLPQKIETG
jgi:hypothetical protein